MNIRYVIQYFNKLRQSFSRRGGAMALDLGGKKITKTEKSKEEQRSVLIWVRPLEMERERS